MTIRTSRITARSGAVYGVDRLSGHFKIYPPNSMMPSGEGKLDKLRPTDRHCSTFVWWVRKSGQTAWVNPSIMNEAQAVRWLVEECDRWREMPGNVARSRSVNGISIE